MIKIATLFRYIVLNMFDIPCHSNKLLSQVSWDFCTQFGVGPQKHSSHNLTLGRQYFCSLIVWYIIYICVDSESITITTANCFKQMVFAEANNLHHVTRAALVWSKLSSCLISYSSFRAILCIQRGLATSCADIV